MCGFVGFTGSNLPIDKKNIINNMMDTIIHRGPDSSGIYNDGNISLGFRRLKIIDMSEDGSQPIHNEDSSCILVFNGEIYNYKELKIELENKGHIFKSDTDSEVLIHSYEEYGVDLLKKVRGMFSFAIWDRNNEELFMARDFFGIKPLYYTQNTRDGSFIFGSEIKSFLKHPSYIKEFNNEALKPYLTFQYSVLDETFFKGVYRLKPGHYMIYKNGNIETKPYWKPNFDKTDDNLNYYVDKIKQSMEESVKYHKISDVKVGSFLSGGIDSSYIASLLKPDNTFSVGFNDYEAMFDETNLAKELSDILKIENHKTMVTAEECFENLSTIQYFMDEPQSNPSVVPLYFLSKLASEHVTVVLSGEGADEIFGGYLWYQTSRKMTKYQKLPHFLRKGMSSLSKALPKNKITDFLVRGGQTIEEHFIGHAIVFEEDEALKVLNDEYKYGPSVQEITKKIYKNINSEDDLSKMQYLDLHLWMPRDILLKADKMSMAHSLELRVPFLDKEVQKLASEIPSELLVDSEKTKYALRVAANEVLPDEWAKRKKLGFPVPIRHWLRDEKYYNIVKDMFQSDIAGKFFNKGDLIEILDAHYRKESDNARRVWTVYVFLIWYKKFFIEL